MTMCLVSGRSETLSQTVILKAQWPPNLVVYPREAIVYIENRHRKGLSTYKQINKMCCLHMMDDRMVTKVSTAELK